ncbi:hypothetical protein DL93DRAFT_2080394 [Clavulina sp. PMI_390]|nr:hypothetical protein DL93DRAFT_2080394 [Clavulina sp. PMI_390]
MPATPFSPTSSAMTSSDDLRRGPSESGAGLPPPPHLANYSPVVPGGSLMIAWQLKGKRVLIVGGGEVASGRLKHVLDASCEDIVLISPSKGLHPEVRYRIYDDPYASKRITYKDREFHLPVAADTSTSTAEPVADSASAMASAEGSPSQDEPISLVSSTTSLISHSEAQPTTTIVHSEPSSASFSPVIPASEPEHPIPTLPPISQITGEATQEEDDDDDLANIDLVLTALDSPTVSSQITTLCAARKIPINAADLPPLCNFFFGSQIRDGALQIMVSTNGAAPKLANIIRTRIESYVLDELVPPESHSAESGGERRRGGIGKVIENVGALRERLRTRTQNVIGGSVGRQRMRWMIAVCETYSFAQLALLSEDEAIMDRLLDQGWEHFDYDSKGGKRVPIVPPFASIAGPQRALRAVVKDTKARTGGGLFSVESATGLVVGMGLGAGIAIGISHWLSRQ